MSTPNDTIDLREVAGTLRREKLWLVGGVVLGLLAALAVLNFAKPTYRASATALLRSSSGAAPSALAMLGGLAGALPGGMESGVETELQLLTSRTVYGAAVDSLDLQAVVLKPAGRGITSILESADFDSRMEESSFEFSRTADGYAVEGDGHRGVATPGLPYQLPGARIMLRREGLPESFQLLIRSREEAIDALQEDLAADEAGGDVARLVYTAGDPVTAARVPNLIVDEYLRRKRTVDRGVNQHKYEFLRARTDSVSAELITAANALRAEQERSGVLDPTLTGEAEIEGELIVRGQYERVRVDLNALEGLLNDGSISGRDVAGFPTLLLSPAVNDMVGLLAELETARDTLLERRTVRDSSIIVLTNSISRLEQQLENLARSHLESLRRQAIELQSELATYEGNLAALPLQAQENLLRQRDVERLAQTELILQTQLIDARLAAITEGGEFRQIDVAVPPEEPAFPRPLPTLAVGLLGGLLLGFVSALGAGYFGQRLRDPYEAELLAGAPAMMFRRSSPLLLGGLDGYKTAIVVPLGAGALAAEVAHQIAATAMLQGRRASVLDLSAPRVAAALPAGTPMANPGAGRSVESFSSAVVPATDGRSEGVLVYRIVSEGVGADRIRAALEQLEEQNELVVALVRGVDDIGTATLLSPSRLVILVGQVGVVTRSEVRDAATSLRRLGITIPGVVLTNGS